MLFLRGCTCFPSFHTFATHPLSHVPHSHSTRTPFHPQNTRSWRITSHLARTSLAPRSHPVRTPLAPRPQQWTALLLRFVLGRLLQKPHVIAIATLLCGVVLTQLDRITGSAAADVEGETEGNAGAWTLGMCLVIVQTGFSGLAATYNEKLLKGNSSLHMANAQLYFYGVVFNLIVMVWQGGSVSFNIFKGFTTMTWIIVGCYSFLGLAISAVMKYSDSIVKIMCTALSVVVTGVVEVVVIKTQMKLAFLVGGVLILYSLVLWNKAPKQQAIATATAAATKVVEKEMADASDAASGEVVHTMPATAPEESA